MNWYMTVLRKFGDFQGRARRKEYWMFTLINIIISLVLGVLDGALGLQFSTAQVGTLGAIYTLLVLIPSIAVSVRRLHDIDKSGWWLLIAFIPLIGAIVLLVFAVMEGTRGANRFGADPKNAIDGHPAHAV